jgi:hypothetical protein
MADLDRPSRGGEHVPQGFALEDVKQLLRNSSILLWWARAGRVGFRPASTDLERYRLHPSSDWVRDVMTTACRR